MAVPKSDRLRPRIAGAALALALAFVPAPQARACAFHTTLPEKSVADWLVDGIEVVLARPAADNAYAFHITEVIHSAGTPPELDLLVSSDLRQRLLANPQDEVLLANDGYGWIVLSYVDQVFRPLMRDVLARAPGWKDADGADRLALFSALQDSPDPDLRHLALLEIDKAPYRVLRDMELRLTPEELLSRLWQPQDYAYQPIRVLLLGLTGSEAARGAIRDYLTRASDWEWANNLGAFATAGIELDGIDGLRLLERYYLANPRQTMANLEQVVEALAIQHGVASPEVRAEIAATLQRFVRARPEGAALIARQFLPREDWSQGALLAGLMEAKALSSAQDLLTVAVYVAQARGAGALSAQAAGSDG
ncbi:hypothetical protein [Salipiger bermudensis]|uniref:hypothetical protein n=1 Tax=Salipiger bermudensis TaxID=344736 RepID=UPI00300BB783